MPDSNSMEHAMQLAVDEHRLLCKEYLQAMANLQCIYEVIFPDSTQPEGGLWIKNEETKLMIDEIKILYQMAGIDELNDDSETTKVC
jgi:hypothetical protein